MKFDTFTMRCIIAETELSHILLNAENFVRELSRAGYTASIGEYSANNYHFVHVGKATSDHEEAKRMRDEIRKINRFTFKEAWILSVE